MTIWTNAKISGTKVAHAIIEDSGGMKLVLFIKPTQGKTKAHVFHLNTGERVKRKSKTIKEDISKLIDEV